MDHRPEVGGARAMRRLVPLLGLMCVANALAVLIQLVSPRGPQGLVLVSDVVFVVVTALALWTMVGIVRDPLPPGTVDATAQAAPAAPLPAVDAPAPRPRERWTLQDLRSAIDLGDLAVEYQPIVDLSDGNPVAAEALVRWQHPHLGRIGPDEFVGRAEQSGLIVPLGRRVLELACRQVVAADLRGRSLDLLGVNVSAAELRDPDYVGAVLGILRGTGLDPRRLVLELTETAFSGHPQVLHAVSALRAHGIRIAIDDFGTGYSSLSRLARLPVDVLKIDRSFVQADPEEGRDHVLATVVSLADAFGLKIVAEGVETAEQADVLRALGCRFAQGHFFGRPAPFDALRPAGTKVLTARPR